MSGFCHLHLHTEYSLLDGAIKIKDLAQRLKDMGMTSCAITDHGVMYGAVSFYREMKANGIHPVIGCEVYVAPGSRFDTPLLSPCPRGADGPVSPCLPGMVTLGTFCSESLTW